MPTHGGKRPGSRQRQPTLRTAARRAATAAESPPGPGQRLVLGRGGRRYKERRRGPGSDGCSHGLSPGREPLPGLCPSQVTEEVTLLRGLRTPVPNRRLLLRRQHPQPVLPPLPGAVVLCPGPRSVTWSHTVAGRAETHQAGRRAGREGPGWGHEHPFGGPAVRGTHSAGRPGVPAVSLGFPAWRPAPARAPRPALRGLQGEGRAGACASAQRSSLWSPRGASQSPLSLPAHRPA